MSGINKVIILGRLGQDPEIKVLDGGKTLAKFSVATSESWTDKTTGEKKEVTEWHRISCFGKLAEICGMYLKKGRQCYLEGKLQTRSYEVDGVKKYATEILADKVEFIGDAQKDDVVANEATKATAPTPAPKQAAPAQRPYNHAPGADNSDTDNMGF
jgi:single-strand DNA-binding protein